MVVKIGRAQALQAVAARQPLRVDFNPILLKPNSDTGAQVIIHGKAISNMEADTYHDYKKIAMEAVLTSHQRLSKDFNLLLVEGAGSPAEINLRENDIANMGYAEAVDCPVIIIADIDKGGVFAHLVGTLALLSESEQNRVQGFVINRFRGDIALLQSGLDWLEQKTGKPVLGVLPYVHGLALDAEDAIAVDNITTEIKVRICVLLLPHISNHTDFDSLRLHPNIDLTYVRVEQEIPACDLIILPGSKNVLSDLAFLKQQGWQQQINQHCRYGGKLLGICGGYQMLGKQLLDPNAIESNIKQIEGLKLLDITTELTNEKMLTQVQGTMTIGEQQCAVSGYEIHCGRTQVNAELSSLIKFDQHPEGELIDGAISDDHQVMGTYLHGIFDNAEATKLILNWVKPNNGIGDAINLTEHRETQIVKFANICREHLAIDKITEIIQQG